MSGSKKGQHIKKVKANGKLDTGRPPIFTSPQDLEAKINEYFEKGIEYRKFVIGRPPKVVKIKIPTITGLAYYLGFSSRHSLYDYEKLPDFLHIIKRAKLKIERSYEEQLQYGNTTGAIFALKNMDWKDKTETDVTTNGESLNIQFIPAKNDKTD